MASKIKDLKLYKSPEKIAFLAIPFYFTASFVELLYPVSKVNLEKSQISYLTIWYLSYFYLTIFQLFIFRI